MGEPGTCAPARDRRAQSHVAVAPANAAGSCGLAARLEPPRVPAPRLGRGESSGRTWHGPPTLPLTGRVAEVVGHRDLPASGDHLGSGAVGGRSGRTSHVRGLSPACCALITAGHSSDAVLPGWWGTGDLDVLPTANQRPLPIHTVIQRHAPHRAAGVLQAWPALHSQPSLSAACSPVIRDTLETIQERRQPVPGSSRS
jgi:hypothetical protein